MSGETNDRVAVKPVSSVQSPPRSLIPGLIIHGAARPQLCLCFPLILSICVWDRRGTPGHTTLSIHTAPCINEHKEEATKKKRPFYIMILWIPDVKHCRMGTHPVHLLITEVDINPNITTGDGTNEQLCHSPRPV